MKKYKELIKSFVLFFLLFLIIGLTARYHPEKKNKTNVYEVKVVDEHRVWLISYDSGDTLTLYMQDAFRMSRETTITLK